MERGTLFASCWSGTAKQRAVGWGTSTKTYQVTRKYFQGVVGCNNTPCYVWRGDTVPGLGCESLNGACFASATLDSSIVLVRSTEYLCLLEVINNKG